MNIKLCLLVVGLVSVHCQAKNTDFQQPIQVDSAYTDASIQQQTLVYSGNVTVKQGSMLIKATTLKVDRSGGDGKDVFIATGNPATYSQLLEGDKPIVASAEEIRYETGSRLLTLTGKAEITQSGSLVRSAKIQYDLDKQKLSAESGKENERVTTIFTPEGQ